MDDGDCVVEGIMEQLAEQLNYAIAIVDLLLEDTGVSEERKQAYGIAKQLMENCFNPGKNDTPETFLATNRVN